MATVKNKESKKGLDVNVPFYKKHIYPLLIFAFSFILYANTISNDYNMDDELVTRNHKHTSKGLSAIPEILTSPYYSDEMGYSYDYRPVVHISFAIEHQFFGESPHVSHFFNALLFACLCALIFFLLKAMLPAPDILILIAVALFVAHPIHTEVVASIKNRDELLMMLFSLASLYAYIRWAESKFILAISLSFVLFTLSMLSKSTALPFAFLIPLSLAFFKRPSNAKYALLSFLLVASGVIFLGNTQLTFKLKIAALLMAANIAAYYAISVANNYEKIIRYVREQRSAPPVASAEQTSETPFFSVNFSLPKGIESVVLSLLWAAVLLSVYSLFGNVQWLTAIGVISILLFLLLSKYRNNAWLILPVFGFCLLILQRYDTSYHVLTPIGLFTLTGLALVTHNKSRALFVSLIFLLILHWFFLSGKTYFLCIIAFAVFLLPEKIKRIAGIIVGALLVILLLHTFFFKVRPNELHTGTVATAVMTLLVYVWLYKPYNPKPLFKVLALIFLVTFILEFFTPQNTFNEPRNLFNYANLNRYNKATLAVSTSVHSLSKVTIQGPVAISTDRPLNYVETPVPLSAPLKVKTASALDILLRYDKLLLIPHPLLFYYGYKVIEPVESFTPLVIFSLLLHFALIVIALLSIRRYPIISWAIIFYLAFLATLTNMFISIPGIIGERYLLVPSLAYCIIAAWLIVKAAEYVSAKSTNNKTNTAQVAKWITVSIVVVYSFGTMYRNSLWKDDITLFSHDIKNAPESAQAHNLLAIHLVQKSFSITDINEQTEMRKRSLYHFKESNRIYPKMFNAAYDIGRAYAMLNMADSAIVAFQYASTLDTNFYNIQLSIAEIYYSQAKYDSAKPYLEYLIRKLPDYYPSYEKLSYILFLQKEYSKSVAVNKQAISKMPNTPEPYINIVRTFIGENKLDSARYYALQAYKVAPQNPMAQQMIRELGVTP